MWHGIRWRQVSKHSVHDQEDDDIQLEGSKLRCVCVREGEREAYYDSAVYISIVVQAMVRYKW